VFSVFTGMPSLEMWLAEKVKIAIKEAENIRQAVLELA